MFPEDGYSRFLQNIANKLPDNMVSHLRNSTLYRLQLPIVK
jgi:hypothetical protein